MSKLPKQTLQQGGFLNSLKKCRSCGSIDLIERFNLGEQFFSGYFPSAGENIDHVKAPLVLLECSICRLVQLGDTFNLDFMYGNNYGYRSGLNSSMVEHLENKARSLIQAFGLNAESRILDIGANDGTFLRSFVPINAELFAVDPTIANWEEFYDFSVQKFNLLFDETTIPLLNLGKFDLISSISMFYDIPDPISFANLIKNHLSDFGIWHVELSYLPSMMKQNSFDTICHEHLEYYSLTSIQHILKEAELKIIKYELNDINGGSITMDITHEKSRFYSLDKNLDLAISQERNSIDENSWKYFKFEVERNIKRISDTISDFANQGKLVVGLGASTKGNVTLQAANLNPHLIKNITEINARKFGLVTPGTNIPIVPEDDRNSVLPDYKLVLPWHFRKHIVRNQEEFLNRGGKLIFPLPLFEIVGNK